MTDGCPELEKRLRAAARYEKGLFGARWAHRLLPLVAGGAIVVAVASLAGFTAGPEILRAGCLVGLVVLAVAGACVAVVRIQREASAKCLDRIMGFPDSALAVVQLAGSRSAWAEAVAASEIPRILGRPFTLPAGRWRWLNWSALMVAALWAGVLWPWPSREHGEQAPAAATEQEMQALQETLRDWEQRAAARENAPVAQVLNEAADSLRNALHARSAGLGEVMVRMARAEDRLRSVRGSLAALRSLSPALARALSGISPRATEALAGNDFAGAADALANPSSQDMPPSEEAASELERLARSLGASGLAALADALGKLARAGSPQESAEALGQLSAALREAGALAQSEPLLDSAEKRLSSVRERMGGSAEGGRAEEDSQGNGGAGASSQGGSKSGEPFRPPGAPAMLAPIPGRLLGQGPTQMEILPSDTGAPENPATPARGSRAVEGELSSEVILPESLPRAYHGIVRRYFEILRTPESAHEP